MVSTHESAVVSTHESAVGASRFSRAREDSSRFVSGFARVRTRHRAVLPLGPYRRRSFVSLDSDSRSALPLPGSRCPHWFSRRAMPLAPRGVTPPTVTPPHRYPPPLLRHRYAPARAPGAGDSASAFAAHPADRVPETRASSSVRWRLDVLGAGPGGATSVAVACVVSGGTQLVEPCIIKTNVPVTAARSHPRARDRTECISTGTHAACTQLTRPEHEMDRD